MSSKGRKIAKNLGKSLRKKLDSDSQTDDSQQMMAELNASRESPTRHLTGSGEAKASSAVSSPSPSMAKSSSLSTIGNDSADPVVNHSEIIALTHDVKNFSDTLAKLKVLFIEGIDTGDDARVVLQNALGEVLAVLKSSMQRYNDLQTPEIFTAARVLINKIKSHDSEELQLDEEELQFYLDAIDQVALAFSRSVSEYLMGDIVTQQQLHTDTKVMSCDNLAKSLQQEEPVDKPEPKKVLTPEELDGVLAGLEAGLDLALQRAKAWSRYTRDIMTYIEKKSQLEMEYAKNVARIAHSMQPVLTSEGFLPLQSVFCTALSQDGEFGSNLQASQALLHTSKFVEPLASRRNEHDRVRKSVKETWDRELRRMHDTVNNLRKAQALYISRQQELERARDTLHKAEADKMEKRKKLEEEAMHKSAEAETTYKACVAEANHRQRSLEKNKLELLGKIREQIFLCDQVIKSVTVDYFSLLHAVWSPVPVQYQTLRESSSGYEPGCQYAEFIKRLPSSASRPSRSDHFTFEAYIPGQKSAEARKISVHSNGSSGEHVHSTEDSPVSSPRRDKYRIPVKAWGQNSSQMVGAVCGSDTDSASGSNKSHESSPSSSPHDLLRRQIVSSQSLEELAEEDVDKLPSSAQQKRGQMKRTMTVGGDENLELPGIMGQQGRRNTMFGVDFQEQVERYKSQVPPLITKCLAEIERRGVMIKGIYRVSGVKSKVENLCQRFDLNPESVDLEEVHPNIISNVLKLYLRQLPEPLLSFRLYSDFIHLAKESMSGYLSGAKLVEKLGELVHRLPPSNFRTCAVLMHHLHRVAGHSDLNHMTCSNLGIVFGPTLLRPLEGTASLASLVDTPHQTRAVELLITNAEAIFGPGDDYQLVPGETPVEALEEETAEETTVTVPPNSSETSPDRSPTKDVTDAFPTPPEPVLSSLPPSVPTAVVPSPSPAPTASVSTPHHADSDSFLVSEVVHSMSSLQPSAADISLPGSANPDRCDGSLSSSGPAVDGQRMSFDSDDGSLSSLDDEDDLADVMLPDQSQEPQSQSHVPLLTPHCMAGGVMKTAAMTRPRAGVGTAPLVDMDPAPETTLAQPVTAVLDSGSWSTGGGPGCSSLPPSPTIKPLHTSSSSSGSVSDGRLSPTKGDNRADRFKLEQRKLLSAIKSDPKLGIVGDESPPSDPKLSGAEREVPVFVENSVSGMNADCVKDGIVEAAPLCGKEDDGGLPGHWDVTESGPTVVPRPQVPDMLKQVNVARAEGVSTLEKSETVGVTLSQKSSTSVVTQEPAETKIKKLDYNSYGSKVQGSADSRGLSGIKLGTASKTDSTARSTLSGAGKSSPVSRTQPSTVSGSQRRSNLTGLSGSSSVSSSVSSGQSSPRSVLSRYPPALTSPSSRRPITSQPPSSTAMARSSTGSGRRSGSTSSAESSPRALSSSASSDTSPTVGSGVRAHRASGEKSGGSLLRDAATRASGGGSATKSATSMKTGLSASRNSATTVGKTMSGSGGLERSSSGGSSRTVSSATGSGSPRSGAGVGKTASSLSTVLESRSSKTASNSGVTSSATSLKQEEKCADSKTLPSATKDLSSDRTPRFV